MDSEDPCLRIVVFTDNSRDWDGKMEEHKVSKYYRVHADVDLDIITSNVEALMKLTPESTGAIAVVKADGYGHGDVAVAKAASCEGPPRTSGHPAPL